MTVGSKALVTKVNTCAATNIDDITAAQLSSIHNTLNRNSVDRVACCALLPTASANIGRMIYVENICSFRYSTGTSWSSDFDTTCTAFLELYTWGRNKCGELGAGDTVPVGYSCQRNSPGTISGAGTNWCHVGAGGFNGSGVKTDGTLWTWGRATRLGQGNNNSGNSPGLIFGGGNTWTISSGNDMVLGGIKTDGTLWTWGQNGAGGWLGNGATGTYQTSPGTTAGGGTTWCSLSLRGAASAIKNDGTLWTWGYNGDGRLGDGTTANRSSPVIVAGGGTNWCQTTFASGVKTDGTLWTWGSAICGALGNGQTAANRSSPGTTDGGGTTWCLVEHGVCAVGAIKTDGTLWTWGANNYGQLGIGNTTNRCSPGTTAGGGTTWCSLSATQHFMTAIKTDGTLWSWGSACCGGTGSGNTTNRSSPGTVVGGLTTWWKVSSANAGNNTYFNTFAITRRTEGFTAV